MASRADWASYAVRMALGGAFLLAGLSHTLVDNTTIQAALRGLPGGGALATALAWGELLAGIGFAAGALLPLDALVAVVIGAGAIVALWPTVVFADLLLIGGAVFLLARGCGPASADAWLVARRPGLARVLVPLRGAAGSAPAMLRAVVAASLLVGVAVNVLLGARGIWIVGERLLPGAGWVLVLAPAIVALLVLEGSRPAWAAGLYAALTVAVWAATTVSEGRFATLGALAALALLGKAPPLWHGVRARMADAASGEAAVEA
jgi:uncharacterized membrane protein YphA (DoxX/SURF4 family)